MSDLEKITYRPEDGEYAWTFGGAAPVMRLRTPCVLDVYTEDAFAGQVTSAQDLVSRLQLPGLNPQTGPFWIEGAEPGDTVAVHFVSLAPARDWAASTTVPLFGALTGTHLTALLHEPLEELMWIWQLDRDKQLCRFTAKKSDFTADLPMDPMHGTVGVAPAGGEVRSALVPDAFGGNMDTPEMRAGTTCYLGVNVPGALLSLGDGHARQGRGRDLRCRGRVRDEHGAHRGPDQGSGPGASGDAVAAPGERRLHHVGRVRAAPGGRVPHRPARHGDLGGGAVRARPDRRLPVRHAGRGIAARQRV
ncbi:MAG: hypothetical protein QOH87_221 [Trebonia sp.]|nr:hypothetical protein [Trebonia sp.]